MVSRVGSMDAAGQPATPKQGHEPAREGFRNHGLAESGPFFILISRLTMRGIGDATPTDVTQNLGLTGPILPVSMGAMGP